MNCYDFRFADNIRSMGPCKTLKLYACIRIYMHLPTYNFINLILLFSYLGILRVTLTY